MRAIVVGLLLICFMSVAPSWARDLPLSMIPPEEELWEAYLVGEIDYHQFEILREAASEEVDSTNAHLLDEIPNLAFFLPLRTEQPDAQASVMAVDPVARRPVGRLRYTYFNTIEESKIDHYRVSMSLQPIERFQFDLQVERSRSGRERFIRRTLRYHSNSGIVRELIAGSFTTRLGLGTIWGYRGMLLDYSELDRTETILFPYYGGFNGLKLVTAKGATSATMLTSVSRNESFSVVSSGGMLEMKAASLRAGLLFGWIRLVNRDNGRYLTILKGGLFTRHRYRNGFVSAEGSIQKDNGNPIPAAMVCEGSHRLPLASIRYAAWAYSDELVDLTSGSKAVNISIRDSLSDVDFGYRVKRPGQEGVTLRTVTELHTSLRLNTSVSYAGRDRDHGDFQLESGLSSKLGEECTGEIIYLTRRRHRTESSEPTEQIRHTIRLQSRINTGNLYARAYIGHNASSAEDDFASAFVNLRYQLRVMGSIELWSNIGKLNLVTGRIRYWYNYLRFEQELWGGLILATKFATAYSYGTSSRYTTTASLQLEATL